MSYNDEAVLATATDSAQSKLTCHNLQYYNDPYIHYFIKPSPQHITQPLINRGYYTRVYCITNIVVEFVQLCKQQQQSCQIISLGAGLDTLYFRLNDIQLTPYISKYVECDFVSSIQSKARIIAKHKLLTPKPDTPYKYNNYQLLPCDLRDIEKLQQDLEQQCNIDTNIPTLVLSECVMIYLSKQHSDAIVQYFASYNDSVFIDYVPIQPNTRFGQTMIENLNQRGCTLQSYTSYPTIESYCDRYKQYNFTCSIGYTMLELYNQYIDSAERHRIERIEWLDEYEEWNIMMSHYCITLAYKTTILQHIDCMRIFQYTHSIT